MAGSRNVKEKKERALNTRLFLKAERCNSHKCVMVRRPYPPGEHGNDNQRRRTSEYGRQLQEKQKIQIVYGLTNKQMRNLFIEYAGNPEKIVDKLERRLDTVVNKLGIAKSQRIARQMVSHGHIWVNGRKVTIPSFNVSEGDEVTIRPKSQSLQMFDDLDVRLKKYETPDWLEIDKDEVVGKLVGHPPVEAIQPFDINLVGEFYTR